MGDPIIVRVVAAICGIGAFIGGLSGITDPHIHGARAHVIVIGIALYFVAASVGTIMLRKMAALMLVAPLAFAGLVGIAFPLFKGLWIAVILNIILSAPLMCAPAFVIYRNWRCLH